MTCHRNPLPLLLSGFLPFLLFIFSHLTPNAAQEVENEREFDYLEWSKKGPEHWGELHEEWGACKHGNVQSPIDLSSQRVQISPTLGKLKRKYWPANATLFNRGHDIELKWVNPAGSIYINGTQYLLKQCHWHSPSEHTILGRRYNLELHIVHESSDPNATNRIAVVGQLYKTGKADPFLSKLTRTIRMMDEREGEETVGEINPREMKISCRRYFRYLGSLTVPPCTEGVLWTIGRKIKTVSRDQVALLRDVVHDYAEKNARPLQQLKSRSIYLYEPGSQSQMQNTQN